MSVGRLVMPGGCELVELQDQAGKAVAVKIGDALRRGQWVYDPKIKSTFLVPEYPTKIAVTDYIELTPVLNTSAGALARVKNPGKWSDAEGRIVFEYEPTLLCVGAGRVLENNTDAPLRMPPGPDYKTCRRLNIDELISPGLASANAEIHELVEQLERAQEAINEIKAVYDNPDQQRTGMENHLEIVRVLEEYEDD